MKKCLKCYQPVEDGEFHQACARAIFQSSVAPLLDTTESEVEKFAHVFIQRRLAVTGVQRKLSLHLDQKDRTRFTIVGILGGNYILKPPSPEFAQLPENEDLTMNLASILGNKTADHSLIRMADGHLAYITRRFDRGPKGKIAMEDLCQLCEVPTENKYRGSHERIGKVIQRYSTIPGDDTLRYFELVIFSFITGNADMHLKNFAMIEDGTDFVLSPAYDLLSTRLVLSEREDPEDLALSLNGKKSKLKRGDFLKFADYLGIPRKVSEKIIERVIKAENLLKETISTSFLSENYQLRYMEIVLERLRRLSGR